MRAEQAPREVAARNLDDRRVYKHAASGQALRAWFLRMTTNPFAAWISGPSPSACPLFCDGRCVRGRDSAQRLLDPCAVIQNHRPSDSVE